MAEGYGLGGLHVGVPRHDGIHIVTGNGNRCGTEFVEEFADLEIVVAGVHAHDGGPQVVAGSRGVLLSADVKTDHLDEAAFKRGVEVFDARVLCKVRSNGIRFDFTRRLQNLLTDILADDALFFQHQHVSAVDREVGKVGCLIVGLRYRIIDVLHNFRGNGLADATAIIFNGRNTDSPQKRTDCRKKATIVQVVVAVIQGTRNE